MTIYKIKLEDYNNKKHAALFTEKEKEMLFNFLEKNPDDERALDFSMRWFNCTMMTIICLMVEKDRII